jgi:hypothetical protein
VTPRTARVLAAATVAATVAVLAGPLPAAVAGGLLLATVLPGLALTALLFRGRRLSAVERTVLAPALSLAVLVLGGLLIYVTGFALDRVSWTSATAGVTLVSLVVPAIPLPRPSRVERHIEIAELAAAAKAATESGVGEKRVRLTPGALLPPEMTELRPPKPPITRIVRQLLPMVLVVAVLAGAGWLSFDSSRSSYDQTVTALSAAPPGDADASGNRQVTITVSGLIAADGPYRIEVLNGTAPAVTRTVAAGNATSWTITVSIGLDRATVNLLRAKDTAAFRTLYIAAAQ